MAVVVHEAKLRRRHYVTSWFSFAWCLHILTWVVVLVVPLFMAFTSGDFWKKQDIYYEHPTVTFRYKSIFLLHGVKADASGNEESLTIAYSSIKQANDVLQESCSLRAPDLTSVGTDGNHDGKMESHNLKAVFPLRTGEKISHVTALLWYDYVLQDAVKEAFESLVYVDSSSGASPAKTLTVYGDIGLVQRNPLRKGTGFANYGQFTRVLEDK